MVHILLEGFDIGASWLRGTLKEYIKPHCTVAVIALSYRPSRVRSLADWQSLYGRENGKYYAGIVGGFVSYGIAEENIVFVNDFEDSRESAVQKVQNADIVYFLGGLPEKAMERIREMELYDALLRHTGVVMGYSAGAVLQLAEYHLSPDEDYAQFGYYEGLPYLDDFYLEVHYQGTPEQNEAIQRVLRERNKPVYAAAAGAGAIVVDNGSKKLLGDVRLFEP